MESEVSQSAAYYRLLAWLEVNKNRILYAAVALLLLSVVVWFFMWRGDQNKVTAGQALSNIFVPQATGRAGGTDPVNDYLRVASEYSGTISGAQAKLLAAASLFEQGKYADAQKHFEEFTRQNSGSPLIPQAAFGIAASLDAQAKRDAALTAYRDLLERYPGENFVPQARFALARLHQEKGDAKLALQNYQDIQRMDPYGQIGSEAGMRIEELRATHPELAPAPPTNSPLPTITLTNAPAGE